MLFVYIQCDDFIEKYGDEIIKLIVNHTDPDTICSLIQLCTSSYATVQLKDTGVFVFICLYLCLCQCVSVCVSVFVFIGPSVCISVFVFIGPSVCISVFVCLYLCRVSFRTMVKGGQNVNLEYFEGVTYWVVLC